MIDHRQQRAAGRVHAPSALADLARVAASTACLIGVAALAVALRYGLYEYFHGDGRAAAAALEAIGR